MQTQEMLNSVVIFFFILIPISWTKFLHLEGNSMLTSKDPFFALHSLFLFQAYGKGK